MYALITCRKESEETDDDMSRKKEKKKKPCACSFHHGKKQNHVLVTSPRHSTITIYSSLWLLLVSSGPMKGFNI